MILRVSRARLLLAGAAAAIAMAAAACSSSAAPVEDIPSPAPTATSASPDPAPTAESFVPIQGGEPVPPAMEPTLTAIEQAVNELRRYTPGAGVDRSLLPREELQRYLVNQFETEESRFEIEVDDRLFKLLGMLPQDLDLKSAYRQLYGTQVAGLYQSETGRLFIVEDDQPDDLSLLEEVTYLHEYYHLLQDDRFDLESLEALADGNRDAGLALRSLVEGDATSLQTEYLISHVSVDRVIGALESLTSVLAEVPGAPEVLQRGLEFPYDAGTRFVQSLAGPQLIAAYGALPVSTEQIIHPEKYLAGEEPVLVELPELAAFLGEGWSLFHEDVLGEFFISLWLDALGSPSSPAAAGWGGDRFALIDGPDGRRALAALIVWDQPDVDSREFFEALSTAFNASDAYTLLANDENTSGWENGELNTLLRLDNEGRTCVTVAGELEAAEKLLRGLGCG